MLLCLLLRHHVINMSGILLSFIRNSDLTVYQGQCLWNHALTKGAVIF